MSGVIGICIIIIFVVTVIKIFQKFVYVWNSSPTCLVGKTAIVTGANTGIGFYVAQDFAKRGATVILACRDETKAKAAQLKIIEETSNPNILTFTLDLSSFSSIRKFVDQIKTTQKEVHILVNNAGALYLDNRKYGDHVYSVKQVNYFGPFLLTVLLLDLLKKSAPSRIVSYSSLLSHLITVDSTSLSNADNKMLDYGQSKLLTVMFINEFANRLKGSGVTANSVAPGEVYTDITRNLPPIIAKPGVYFRKFFFKAPELGAQTPIYVAVSKDVENATGKYFDNCREAWCLPMPALAENKQLRKEIFEKTLKLISLTDKEIHEMENLLNNK